MERLKLDIQRFATSGRIQTPANEDGSYFFLMWNISSQSIENNTSTIYWVLYINAAYNYYTNAVSTGAVVINGQTVHSGGTYSNINSGERAITAGRTTIPHNSDGTKSFSVSISGWTLGCSWVSKTQSFTLKTIPRASKIDSFTILDSQNRANIEGTYNVKYTRFASQFSDNLVLEYSITPNDTTSWTDLKTIENYVSGTDFTLTSAEINTLYTATANKENGAVSLRVYMKTYNGETFIGDGEKSGLWAFVLDADPVFTNFAFEDINPTTLALTNNDYHTNIKGYSNISIGVSQQDRATALKGASITSYIINDTYTLTKQEFETNGFTINNCETGTFKVVARDSRGKTKDVTKYATQNIQYNPISLSERDSKIERNNNNVGTSAKLTLNGKMWVGNFGATTNAIDSNNTYYELKITDSSGNFIRGNTNITPTVDENGNLTLNGITIASDNPDYSWNLDDSYYINVYVKDKLSSSSIQLVLNSAIPNISIDKKGVGINCAYDPDIGGSLQVDGQKVDPNASGIPNGSEFQFDGSTVPDGYEQVDDPYAYSTSEIKTNKTWVDGKPIYRKCVANSSSVTNGTHISLSGISNMETLTNIISKAVRSTGAQIFGNYFDSTSNKFTLQYYASSNYINVWAGSETLTATVFVEYTKTTD